jgi:hypothetical protein
MASKPTDKRPRRPEARSDAPAQPSDGRSGDELADRRARFVEGLRTAAAERQLEAVAPWLARLQDENQVARFAQWLAEHGDDAASMERWATLTRVDQLALTIVNAANVIADSNAPAEVVQRAMKHEQMISDIIENRRRGRDGRCETELWIAIVEGVEAIALRMEQCSRMEPALTFTECAEWVPAAVASRVTSVDLIHSLEANVKQIEAALAAWGGRSQWAKLNELFRACRIQTPVVKSMRESYSRHMQQRRIAQAKLSFKTQH